MRYWKTLNRWFWGRDLLEITRSFSFLALLTAFVFVAQYAKRVSKSPNPREWNIYSAEANEYLYTWRNIAEPVPQPLIAHAAGKFGEVLASNSLEALDENYAAGIRLFEMDFNWTRDDHVVAVHDWEHYDGPKSLLGGPTLAEFEAHESRGFTPTTLERLYSWLEQHPDAFVVTDLKRRGLDVLAQIRMERPNLVPQFIVQIYLFKDHELVQSLGFKHIILTLYRCLDDTPDDVIVDFCRDHPLFAVTMPAARASRSDLARRLQAMGLYTYAHTIDDVAEFQQLQRHGIDGVYSDVLVPQATRLAAVPVAP